MKARSAVFQGFMVLLLVLLLIVFSEHGFRASQEGLKLFFDVVLPSLLPFFILSDVLLAYGMVHFLGELFEPLMRPLFNVPGTGSFVLSMGLAAGYPMDAVITAKFRKQNMCTRVEGERMLAFSNTADPLFLLGAVSVGMLGLPVLGAVLALAHYAGALLVGLSFRGWGRREEVASRVPDYVPPRGGIWRRATAALLRAREQDGRPLGQILQEAIRDSIATLFMIMSFIVLFSVLVRVLDATGIMNLLLWPTGQVLHLVGVAPDLGHALIQGFFEIDIGSAAAAHASAPLMQRLALISAIVAWSGLSVQGQVSAVLSGTDIRMRPYIMARILHAMYAAVLTVIFLPILQPHLPALLHLLSGTGPTPPFLTTLLRSSGYALGAVGASFVAAFLVGAARSMQVLRMRVGR